MTSLPSRKPAVNQNDQRPAPVRPSVQDLSTQKESPWIAIGLGLAATIVFYIVAPRIPGQETLVYRYFCSHPVCYASTAMFFIGMSILLGKLRRLRAERSSVATIKLMAESAPFQGTSRNPETAIQCLSEWVLKTSETTGSTLLIRRILGAIGYVRSRQDGGLDDHLRYLADLASERLQQSFALLRTITWAIPIMGFLGTVLGITIAIANVTPEQLDSSLPEVTAGLAIAFDTTAQALGMSVILVFGAFLIERAEQDMLNQVEQFGIDQLSGWLSSDSTQKTESQTGISGISEWTQLLLQEQTQSWARHLSDLQSGWVQALSSQSEHLTATLSEETEQTLQSHRDTAGEARDAYTAMLQQSTRLFAGQLQQSLEAFGQRVDSWQNALQTSSLASAAQAEELHRFGRTLLELTESEQRLSQMQKQLNDNLQSLRVVETLEQTVNSLNAAVHVLTAKTSLRAAA